MGEKSREKDRERDKQTHTDTETGMKQISIERESHVGKHRERRRGQGSLEVLQVGPKPVVLAA